MDTERIHPHKVTKPIQLLAAWLVGLVATNTLFLGSAAVLGPNGWERSGLVIAAMANVPLFLAALFLLQTRFRAELQEDSYYADYLSKKTDSRVKVDKGQVPDERIGILEARILELQHTHLTSSKPDSEIQSGLDWSNWRIALNISHPRYSEIREALRLAKVPLAEIFGNPKKPPSRWLIALSIHLPIDHKVALLRLLLPFGFTGFQLWEPIHEAEENEDVYIGSYGEEYAIVTPALQTLLATEVAAADLTHYYSTNQRS